VQLDPLGFSLSYGARVVEHSGTGVRPDREFPDSGEVQQPRQRGPWLHVRVEPHGGLAWTGAFELDAPGYYLTGLYGLPSGEDLLVVAAGAGYVVPVRNPAEWHRPPIAPVIGVRRVEDSPLAVLWDFQDLAVYGPEGPLWHRLNFATDDLDVTHAPDGVIEGTRWRGGWGGMHHRDHRLFRLDAATGRVLDGDEDGQLKTGAAFWDR
jgi:hypothetical protein